MTSCKSTAFATYRAQVQLVNSSRVNEQCPTEHCVDLYIECLAVHAEAGDGHDWRAILPKEIRRMAVQRLAGHDREKSLSKTVRYFPYTDEGVDMMEARGVTENFGTTVLMTNAPVYFAGPRVHLPEGLFEATVGAELFRRTS